MKYSNLENGKNMKDAAPYNRINPFGTSEHFFKINDERLTFNHHGTLKKDDILRCNFIEPMKVVNNKYYVLETYIEGEFIHYARFAKVENGFVEFICLNPDFKDDKIKVSVSDIQNHFTGIAEVIGYDRY